MSDIPLPIIGIMLAICGFILTRLLAPKARRPLSAMRPTFDSTTLDENELGNEAMDMDLVRSVEAKNQRLAHAYSARWGQRPGAGRQTQKAIAEHSGDKS